MQDALNCRRPCFQILGHLRHLHLHLIQPRIEQPIHHLWSQANVFLPVAGLLVFWVPYIQYTYLSIARCQGLGTNKPSYLSRHYGELGRRATTAGIGTSSRTLISGILHHCSTISDIRGADSVFRGMKVSCMISTESPTVDQEAMAFYEVTLENLIVMTCNKSLRILQHPSK